MAEFYADGQSFGGLGYSSSTQQEESSATLNAASTNANEGSKDQDVAGDMLKNLMQQCLDYHHDQQHHHPQLELHPQHANNAEADLPTTIEFPTTVTMEQQNQQPTGRLHQSAEEGRSRANAILAKFQQLTRDHGGDGDGGGLVSTEPLEPSDAELDGIPLSNLNTSSSILAASEFREKRENCMAKENLRKQAFLIKNFEYVARRDARRLQKYTAQINEAKQWEDQVQNQYRQVLEERKKKLLNENGSGGGKNMTTQAGIGTNTRKRAEKEKHRTGNVPLSKHLEQDSSVSVYLSGIPKAGSVSEDLILQLFASYGTIRKVHFYRHKGNGGQLKGDGLVVYELDKSKTPKERDNDKNVLLQSVCSQVRKKLFRSVEMLSFVVSPMIGDSFSSIIW